MTDPTERANTDTEPTPLGGSTEFLIQFDLTDPEDPELVDVVQLDE